jgi:uncharacterized protein YecE (DUF72 family)
LPPLVPSASTARLFAGTSGWAYATWKPAFYPEGTRAKDFLSYYATQMTSVEVNYTFRKLPEPKQLTQWLAATPAGFRFTFKAPQQITHFQRLRGSEETVAEFVQSLAPVKKAGKLGALLFQLPPNFKVNLELLDVFLRLKCLRGKSAPPLAFEFRHESWFTDATYAVLRKHRAALCIAESEDLTTPDIQTAPHAYYRLRCPAGYSPRKVKAFAAKFAELSKTTDTYVYFKHEDAPTGALNAQAMLQQIAKVQA